MADFIVGGVARDDDFLFREHEIEDLWDLLKKDNVLLLSPRRNGKTSVMYRMLDQPLTGWHVVHLNVEDLSNPTDFIICLINALDEHQPDYLRQALRGMTGFFDSLLKRIQSVNAFNLKLELRKDEDLKENWRERGTELVESLCASDINLLFIIDEFPDMLATIDKEHEDLFEPFLHWFRKLREKTLATRIRWMIGGSVNLTAALDRKGMVRLVNDLRKMSLPPFTNEQAKRFICQNLDDRDVGYSPEIVDKIIGLLGSPIPYFLQLFVQELFRFWRRSGRPKLAIEHVNSVFSKSLLGEVARDKLQHFRTRIDTHYGDEKLVVCKLLDSLSATENGASRRVLFQLYRTAMEEQSQVTSIEHWKQEFGNLLQYLESDFYIEDDGQNVFDFTNKLLKIWWRKHYGYDLNG